MSDTTHLSIPCQFEEGILTIKALNFKSAGDTPDQAILECIKGTPMYASLISCEFISFTDFRGRTFMHLEVPFDAAILKRINDIEPLPTEAKRKHKSLITDVSPEEALNFAYPDLGKL